MTIIITSMWNGEVKKANWKNGQYFCLSFLQIVDNYVWQKLFFKDQWFHAPNLDSIYKPWNVVTFLSQKDTICFGLESSVQALSKFWESDSGRIRINNSKCHTNLRGLMTHYDEFNNILPSDVVLVQHLAKQSKVK